MPAPGEQHTNSGGRTITNPFEDVKPRISEYTAQEIATLQSRLEKQLGPEYISSRSGPSGQKVHYLAAEKCIQLANEVFGFNGWSSQIMDCQVDFVDENTQTMKVSLGLSVVVRVTLRDGTFHEDIGYGHMENCKGKAAAFEKAKKEGTTDALKRALRNFGNVLGNCIYDKEYLKNVTKVKAHPVKWDVDKLHRHSTFITPIKMEETSKFEKPTLEDKTGVTGASISTLAAEDNFDDEFGDFDEADFSVADPDSHPDEVTLPEPPVTSHHLNNARTGIPGAAPNQNKPPVTRQQPPGPPGRPVYGQQGNGANTSAQPQTPNGGFIRSNSGAGPQPRPMQAPQLNAVAGRVLNQPSRNGPPSAPVSPTRLNRQSDESDNALPPQGTGFYSARAATMLPDIPTTEAAPPPLPNHLPAFNLHAESPSIRKTPGVDHKSSKPLTKDLKHVPGSSQAVSVSTLGSGLRNVVNPQMDATRRIGAPGMGGTTSPMGNRGGYKPPSMLKRPPPTDGNGRAPLTDLPPNGPIGGEGGSDIKRQRMGN